LHYRKQKGHYLATWPPSEFSSFSDKKGYCGFVPSVNYLTRMYVENSDRLKPYFDREVSKIAASIRKVDHSHKICKHMARINGEQVFKALYTGVNELEQIRLQKFTVSTSSSHLN
jgi:hypothetical protein